MEYRKVLVFPIRNVILRSLGYTWRCRSNSKNKIETIVDMDHPRNRKEVNIFIGMINYYRYMWDRRSHALQELTKFTSVYVKLKWASLEQELFEEIKQIVQKETLLLYQSLSKRFDIHIDEKKINSAQVLSKKKNQLIFTAIRSQVLRPRTL